MKPKEQTSFTYRVIEHAMKLDSFCLNDIPKGIPGITPNEHNFLVNVMFTELISQITPNTIFCLVDAKKDRTERRHIGNIYDLPCMLLPQAVFSYTDHEEIRHARETAIESKRLAWIAIIISILGACAELYSVFLK